MFVVSSRSPALAVRMSYHTLKQRIVRWSRYDRNDGEEDVKQISTYQPDLES